MMDVPGGAGGAGGDAAGPGSLVAYGERTMYSMLSLDTTLESDGFTNKYLVVPLCFGNLKSPEPRKFTLAALSTQVLSLETVALAPSQLAQGVIALTLQHGERTPF